MCLLNVHFHFFASTLALLKCKCVKKTPLPRSSVDSHFLTHPPIDLQPQRRWPHPESSYPSYSYMNAENNYKANSIHGEKLG